MVLTNMFDFKFFCFFFLKNTKNTKFKEQRRVSENTFLVFLVFSKIVLNNRSQIGLYNSCYIENLLEWFTKYIDLKIIDKLEHL